MDNQLISFDTSKMFEKYKLVWINVILIPYGEGCMQF